MARSVTAPIPILLGRNQPSDKRQLTPMFLPIGQSQFLTSPIVAKPLKFSELSLNDKNYDEDLTRGVSDSDTRLMEMLAAQAAHSAASGLEDEDAIAASEKTSDEEKREMLQKILNMAASNGNVDQVNKILSGKARNYVDINAQDDDGTPPLIYASCFVRVNTH